MARRKKSSASEEGGDDFMLMFTALMLILLAFFILLNTMAVIDEKKSRTAIGSLHHSFTSPFDGFLKQALESLHAIRSDSPGDQVIIEDLIDDLEEGARQQGLGMPGDIQALKGGFYPRLTVANHVFYYKGGTEITPRAFPLLDRIANAAEDLNSTVVIESHTSAGPVEDRRHRSHWELSAERAANLQRYLVEASGLTIDRVEAQGVADTRRPNDQAKDVIVITLRPLPPTGNEAGFKPTIEPGNEAPAGPAPKQAEQPDPAKQDNEAAKEPSQEEASDE